MLTAVAVAFSAALPFCSLAAADSADPDTAFPRTFSGRAQVTAVELVVEVDDGSGAVPTDLTAADFEVLEDGSATTVLAVEPFGRAAAGRPDATPGGAAATTRIREDAPAWSWKLVVWVDQAMSSSRSIRRAAESLAAEAGRLTALGTVEIVVTGDQPKVVLPPTRSAHLVADTLRTLARETTGRDELRALRRRFLETLQLQGELDSRNQPQTVRLPSGGGGGGDTGGGAQMPVDMARDRGAGFSRENAVRGSLADELMLLGRRQDLLLNWAAGRFDLGPRALMLVNDGWDLDPRSFYLAGAPFDSRFTSEVMAYMSGKDSGTATDALARSLSAYGWVTLAIASGTLEAGTTVSAEMSGHGRLGEIVAGGEDSISELPSALIYRAAEPLDQLADETGGEVMTGLSRLPGALDRLGRRVRLSYQVTRNADTDLHKVVVRAKRPGLEVKAPRWVGAPAAETIAASRVRGLLLADPDRGDLPLQAVLAVDPSATSSGGETGKVARQRSKLQARVDLRPISGGLEPDSALRVSVAVALTGHPPWVRHEVLSGQQLAGLAAWTYSAPVELPAEAERVAVVIEELGSGAWGGALAALAQGLPEFVPEALVATAGRAGQGDEVDEDAAVPLDLLPASRPLLLLRPEVEPVVGKVQFEPLVTDPNVASIALVVDGEAVDRVERAPFVLGANLGSLPVPRVIEAIAYDAGGHELGRDRLTVNQGAGPLSVEIIDPRSSQRVGLIDVEAEVRVPADQTFDRLELRWNDALVGTMFEPPFRQRILVPPDAPVGVLTVEAHTKSGGRAEDVMLLNGGGVDDSVEVRVVELPTVVLDVTRRPVRDLQPSDFTVREDGVAQTLIAGDGEVSPLTLGLLVDSSASMFEEMNAVKAAAIDFLFLTLGDGDRGFVVDFDDNPRLAQDLTSDPAALATAVGRLEAGGATALCDALVFALARLQQVRGRRAVVVLSDGLGRADRTGFGTCQRFVLRSGVPVYLLLMPGMSAGEQAAGVDQAAIDKARKLVEPSGGRVLALPATGSLGAVFRDIHNELAAQYLLSYTPAPVPADSGDGGWRRIEAEVTGRPELAVRTISGYLR